MMMLFSPMTRAIRRHEGPLFGVSKASAKASLGFQATNAEDQMTWTLEPTLILYLQEWTTVPRCSMYGIYADQLGWFEGSM